jgi:hypothetical protein
MSSKLLERDSKGRIIGKPMGEKPLSRRTMTLRLDEETDRALREMENKNEFIREVLAEAVRERDRG